MSAPRRDIRAAVPGAAVEIIVESAPGVEVVAIDDLVDLDGFDFLVPLPLRSGDLADRMAVLPRLSVVQTLSAGVDRLQDSVPEWVTLCSARGARDAPVAEWVRGVRRALAVPAL